MQRQSSLRAILAAAGLLLAGAGAEAQSSKAAKDANKLADAGRAAETAVADVVSHVQSMVERYNGILDGSAKNPESSYKKLVGDLRDARRRTDGANQSVDSLSQRAESYFAEWDAELERFDSESLKRKSRERRDSAKQHYATMSESLDQASEAFTPLLQNFDDQILFLSRDLSPEALADLGTEAQALNRQADDLFVTVGALMARARGAASSGGEAIAD